MCNVDVIHKGECGVSSSNALFSAKAGIVKAGIVMVSVSRPLGRYAPRNAVEDAFEHAESVVQGFPSSGKFVKAIVRELKIRFYQQTTISSYRNSVISFLRWFGGPPHRIQREDVRNYLEYLVDAGLQSATVSNHLAAIRTAFDKLCLRSITVGLAVPRRSRKLPVVLSSEEVIRLLQSAISLRDKLLLGLMYAAGLRVSEVVRLCWRDVDFDRQLINVWQGKGRTDRQVLLPRCYESLLRSLSKQSSADAFMFPGERAGRHLSSRTAQRIMSRTVRIAGIDKPATPHSLRHSFATHSFENGCDIRRIQKLLGHVRLETTTIYVRVARPSEDTRMPSPLDVLVTESNVTPPAEPKKEVGRIRIHTKPEQSGGESHHRSAKVTLEVRQKERPIYFTGIVASEQRPGLLRSAFRRLRRGNLSSPG